MRPFSAGMSAPQASAVVKPIISIIIVLALLVPAVAVASRVATGSTRDAIDRAAVPLLPPASRSAA